MSIWSSILCPVCKSKGNELSIAVCYNAIRLSCHTCDKQWIVVIDKECVAEIERQIQKKVTREMYEFNFDKAEKRLGVRK